MSSSIGKLPPPWPNAALTLTKVAGELQIRENVERVTDTSPEARSERRDASAESSSSSDSSAGTENRKNDSGVNVVV